MVPWGCSVPPRPKWTLTVLEPSSINAHLFLQKRHYSEYTYLGFICIFDMLCIRSCLLVSHVLQWLSSGWTFKAGGLRQMLGAEQPGVYFCTQNTLDHRQHVVLAAAVLNRNWQLYIACHWQRPPSLQQCREICPSPVIKPTQKQKNTYKCIHPTLLSIILHCLKLLYTVTRTTENLSIRCKYTVTPTLRTPWYLLEAL